jgi:trimethylamine--corrinoid protein Co-methyltransferase
MFSLLTTVNSGVDFVLHSAGILSSFLTFSFEKFVLDDEICGMIRHYHKGFRVDSDTLAYDVIADVSPGGNFLMEMHTIERCRSEFWQPDLVDRRGLDAWMQDGRPQVVNQASARWKTLLSEHSDPHLDEITKRQLNRYVKERTY